MKQILAAFCFCLLCLTARAQSLYVKMIGDPHAQPLIFIHGGPGSSTASFEATTARLLADKGFYVIFYDRRGEGRSVDPHAAYTFKQTFSDLDAIYKQAGIKKATLIGMSFGGVVATLYTRAHPEKVKSLLLVSSLLAFQDTYKTIIRSCSAIYIAKQDTAKLNDLVAVTKLDSTSYEYRNSCFQHAYRNGFFQTPTPTAAASARYAAMEKDTLLTLLPDHGNQPSYSFWLHEKYSSLNLLPYLKQLSGMIKIYALYGKDDGLYSPAQVQALQQITGADHLVYLEHCAHYVFIDRQDAFLDACAQWLK